MQFILNVGLDGVPVNGDSYTNGARNPRRIEQLMAVVQAARRIGFKVLATKMVESDTEPTAVLTVECPWISGAHGYIRQLAQATGQQCIACWKPDRVKGVMLGATIDLDNSWGEFNPALFIMPDGSRLAAQKAAA